MCGRFVLKAEPKDLADFFQLAAELDLPARYNIAPSQPVAAVLAGPEGRTLKMLRWGLVPAWAKDVKIGARLINARAETIFDKPAFRSAVRKRRCLIPADGFFEWGTAGGVKRPFYIHLRKSPLFAIAGIWEYRESPDGEALETCALLTVGANELLLSLHQRMPVILEPASFDRWLDPKVQDRAGLEHLLVAYPAEKMVFHPVSRAVDNPRNDQPYLIEPLKEGRE